MRSVLWIAIFLLAVSAGAEPVITFPGKVTRVKAPNSELAVTYFDPGENAAKYHEYSLRFESPGRRFREIDVFMRSVDVSWSAAGERFFVTDYIGSNVADCYVFKPGGKGLRKTSLTDVLARQFPRIGHLMGVVDHSYVGCTKWTAPNQIKVIAEGHGAQDVKSKIWTDFEYVFVYNAATGTATQVSGSVKKGKF